MPIDMQDGQDGVVFYKSLAQYPNSKQEEDVTLRGILNPPISFYALQKAYEDSFILGGIFEKLSSSAHTGFKQTKNKDLDKLLATLDVKYVFENILVFGNAYVEKVRNGKWTRKKQKR